MELAKFNMQTASIGGACATITLIVLEHCSKKNLWPRRPSDGFQLVADYSTAGFRNVGEGLAIASSFLTCIEYRDIMESIKDLVRPIIQLVGSPLNVATGYVDTALSYAKKSSLIYTGSAIIMIATGFLMKRFCPWNDTLCNIAIKSGTNLMYVGGMIGTIAIEFGAELMYVGGIVGTIAILLRPF